MQQVQLTFKQLAEAALKLGATPNAIRVWRQRGIRHRYQVKLMQHFNGALKIIDWSPDGDAIATIAHPPTLADICRERFGDRPHAVPEIPRKERPQPTRENPFQQTVEEGDVVNFQPDSDEIKFYPG